MELDIWNIVWELLKSLSYKWHTHLSCFYSCLLIVAGGSIFGFNADLNSKERFHFSCYKSEKPQQDECQVAYNTGPNILHNSFIIPGVQFLFPMILLLTRFVVMKISSEHKRKICGKTVHMYAVHFFEITVRLLFYLMMIVIFAEFEDHVIVKPNFYCILDLKQNHSAPFRCTDVKADAKTALNVLSFVLNIILCLLSFCECYWLLRKLHNNWFLLPDSAGACPRCAHFQNLLIDFDRSSTRELQREEEERAERLRAEERREARELQREEEERAERLRAEEEKWRGCAKKLRKQYYSLSKIAEPFFKGDDETFSSEETDLKEAMVEICLLESDVCRRELSRHNERWQYLEIIDKLKTSKIDVNDLILPESKLCYVRGIAGIGKSCLIDLITLKWADEEMLCDKNPFGFKLLFRFQLRDWNWWQGKQVSVDDVFRDKFRIEIKDIEREIGGENILILLDGLDEYFEYEAIFADNKESISSVLCDLVRKDSPVFPGHYTVITGRPHAIDHLNNQQAKTGKARMVEIIGFTDEMMENYLYRLDDSLRKQLLGKIQGSLLLRAFCQVPLFLRTICYIAKLEDEGDFLDNISTVTDLYASAFAAMLIYHFKPNRQDSSIMYVPDLFYHESVRDFLNVIGKLSYDILLDKSIIFEYRQIKNIHGNDPDPDLHNLIKAFTTKTGRNKYQFVHLSFQEFFAAYHCFKNRIKINELLKSRMYEVIVFYGGFIKASNDKREYSIKSWLIGGTEEISETFKSDFLNAICDFRELPSIHNDSIRFAVIFELFDVSDQIPPLIKFPSDEHVFCWSPLTILQICHFVEWRTHGSSEHRLGNIDLKIFFNIDQKTFEQLAKHIYLFRRIDFFEVELNIEFTKSLSDVVDSACRRSDFGLHTMWFSFCEFSEGAWMFFSPLIPRLSSSVDFDNMKLTRKLSSSIISSWTRWGKILLPALSIQCCTFEDGCLVELAKIIPFIGYVKLDSLELSAAEISEIQNGVREAYQCTSSGNELESTDFPTGVLRHEKCSNKQSESEESRNDQSHNDKSTTELLCYRDKSEQAKFREQGSSNDGSTDSRSDNDKFPISDSVCQQPRLIKVSLSNCGIGGKGAGAVLAKLIWQLDDVNLSRNNFVIEDIEEMTTTLSECNKSLGREFPISLGPKSISLSECMLGGKGLGRNIMKIGSFAEKIDLSSNRFTHGDLEDMADYLKEATTAAENRSDGHPPASVNKIKKLSLNNDDLVGRWLGRRVTKIAMLCEEIDLSYNIFTPDHLKDMADYLKEARTTETESKSDGDSLDCVIKLKKLSIQCCEFEAEHARDDLVTLLSQFEIACLVYNNFSHSDVMCIAEVLTKLKADESRSSTCLGLFRLKELDLVVLFGFKSMREIMEGRDLLKDLLKEDAEVDFSYEDKCTVLRIRIRFK